MKTSSYMTRAMKSKDPRYARILGRLGYEVAQAAPEAEEIPAPVARQLGSAPPLQPVAPDPAPEPKAAPAKPVSKPKKAKPVKAQTTKDKGSKPKATAKTGRYKTRALKAEG